MEKKERREFRKKILNAYKASTLRLIIAFDEAKFINLLHSVKKEFVEITKFSQEDFDLFLQEIITSKKLIYLRADRVSNYLNNIKGVKQDGKF